MISHQGKKLNKSRNGDIMGATLGLMICMKCELYVMCSIHLGYTCQCQAFLFARGLQTINSAVPQQSLLQSFYIMPAGSRNSRFRAGTVAPT